MFAYRRYALDLRIISVLRRQNIRKNRRQKKKTIVVGETGDLFVGNDLQPASYIVEFCSLESV